MKQGKLESSYLLCVFLGEGHVGGVVFEERGRSLEFIEDCPEQKPFLNTSSLVHSLSPSTVLVKKGNKDFCDFLSHLKSELEETTVAEDEDLAGNRERFALKELGFKMFDLENATKRLLATKLPGMPSGLSDAQCELYIRSLLPLLQNSPCMVRAAGALLSYLDQQSSTVFGHHVLHFAPATAASLKNRCVVDEQSLRDLGVFSRDLHPSVVNKGGASKEGYSLFSLFDKTKTPSGHRLLKHWFHSPLKIPALINERLELVDLFYRNFDCTQQLRRELIGVQDVYPLLRNLQSRSLTGHNFKTLLKTCQKGKAILGIMAGLMQSKGAPIRSPQAGSTGAVKDTSNVTPHSSRQSGSSILEVSRLAEMRQMLKQIEHWLNKCVDWDRVGMGQRLIVKSGVDEGVDVLRSKYSALPQLLKQLVTLELDNFSGPVELRLVYIPSLGFFVAVGGNHSRTANQSHSTAPAPLTTDPDYHLDFVFYCDKEDKTYFKDATTVQLDNCVGDILLQLRVAEERVLSSLQKAILTYSSQLVLFSQFVGYLDAILCMALAAKSYNLVRPTVHDGINYERNDNNNNTDHDNRACYISIIKGWNLLVCRVVDQFVPNSLHFSPPPSHAHQFATFSRHSTQNSYGQSSSGRVMVLSGPNASGKSVLLKQTGQILFLAHLGSFVPAKSVSLSCPLDSIFVRLTVDTSVQQRLSSFASHIAQISLALNNCTDRSVILIDEFARGTSSVDASCLLKSLVLHYSSSPLQHQQHATIFGNNMQPNTTADQLSQSGRPSPIMIVATHSLHAVRDLQRAFGKTHSVGQVSFCRMKFARIDQREEDTQQSQSSEADKDDDVRRQSPKMVFLYKLEEGVADYSYAEQVALSNGAPAEFMQLLTHFQLKLRTPLPVQAYDDTASTRKNSDWD
ncbi:mutS protein homolog 5-like [Symsagittifera roscoffensis]|uniref:mutS protein homolog 5-like n=1 Tax=Symsagittifera roscoffensis TaxID=84072 RepID=UPI00307C863C